MASPEQQKPVILTLDAERKLGRNARCWCGSGKRYKSCHEEVDRFLRSLPKMSALLIEIATPLLSPSRTRSQTQAAMMLAALAWNITRFEGSAREEMLEKARGEVTEEGMLFLKTLMLRASRWPEDRRVVQNVEVVQKGDGSFDVNASVILAHEQETRPQGRHPSPRAAE